MKKQYDLEKAEKMFADGYTLQVIGERLGVSKETIRRNLKKSGIDTSQLTRSEKKASTYGEIAKKIRASTGKAWWRISQEIGFSERQLRRYVSGNKN